VWAWCSKFLFLPRLPHPSPQYRGYRALNQCLEGKMASGSLSVSSEEGGTRSEKILLGVVSLSFQLLLSFARCSVQPCQLLLAGASGSSRQDRPEFGMRPPDGQKRHPRLQRTLHTTESEVGVPQGGVIIPLLVNIALHGMEKALGVRYEKKGQSSAVGLWSGTQTTG
jgi:hypothetical protein